MRSQARRLLLLVPLVVAVLAAAAESTTAKTLKVNKRGDHVPGKCDRKDCTLREATIAAAAKDGDDVIKLPSRKPYRLSRDATKPGPDEVKGDLDFVNPFGLDNDVRIVHPGKGRATIDAGKSGDRAIESIGAVWLKKLVVRRGATLGSGGGIHADGTLIIRNSRIVRNETGDAGGGIEISNGSLFVIGSVVKRNGAWDGGGLFVGNSASLQLTRSTLSRNEAKIGSGGGAWIGTGLFFGASRITASTIDHNSAAADGGGLIARAADLRIENSTLTRNRAAARGGGIYSRPGSEAKLNGVTIARNVAAINSGGGIYADGGSDVIEMRNSLLAGNESAGGVISECDAPAPVGINSLGGNLLGGGAGGCSFFTDPEDIVAAPKLGGFGDHGGPTETVPLRKGSPAIGQADGPGALTRDQRGVPRKNPDIGAFER
jgi:fibronectin-binding autotransporter adhesin